VIRVKRPIGRAVSHTVLWDQCRAGLLPAEVLDTVDRGLLVIWFWERRWTDVEIAYQTRMSTYTVGRIRERIGLPANRGQTEGVA
jgi:hypothetical protein